MVNETRDNGMGASLRRWKQLNGLEKGPNFNDWLEREGKLNDQSGNQPTDGYRPGIPTDEIPQPNAGDILRSEDRINRRNPSGCIDDRFLVASTGPVTEAERQAVSKSSNTFSLNLYSKLAAQNKGNFYFAGFSIYTAASQVLAGARDTTAERMREGMHVELAENRHHAAVADLQHDLTSRKVDGELKIANRTWCQDGMNFTPEFTKVTTETYAAAPGITNFKADPEAARQQINKQVEVDTTPKGETEGKIKDLIPKGIIDGNTRFVITNAFYYKDKFVQALDDGEWNENFHGREATTPVKMMHGSGNFGYANIAGAGLQVLELPAKGDTSLVLFIPTARNGIDKLESQMNEGNVSGWLSQVKQDRVGVTMPTFTMKSSMLLKDTLSDPSFGFAEAFSEGAHFEGITTEQKCHLTQAVHQGTIDVTPDGFETAAATAFVGGLESCVMPPKTQVVADRPFVFMIRDNQKGTILSAGRCDAPEAPKSKDDEDSELAQAQRALSVAHEIAREQSGEIGRFIPE